MTKKKPTVLLLTTGDCNLVRGAVIDTIVMNLEYFNDTNKLMQAICGFEITSFISDFDKSLLNDMSLYYTLSRLRSDYKFAYSKSDSTVQHITCESGDWEVLRHNSNIIAQGHTIRNQDWVELLNGMNGVIVFTKILSDEDMESLYGY